MPCFTVNMNLGTEEDGYPCKYIINVLGPRAHREEQELALAACYTDCLDEMIKRGCRSLAFSSLDPPDLFYLSGEWELAAMKATRDWLGKNYQSVEKIIFYKSHSRAVTTTMAQVFPVYVDDGICLPVEILRMDSRSIEMYKRALAVGKVSVYNIRVMLVGHSGVGKTTLLNRLLNRPVKIEERESTEGIDVRVCQCKIDPETGQWINSEGESQTSKTHLLASALHFSETSGESNRPLDGSGESGLPVRKTTASHRDVQEVEDHNPFEEYGNADDPVHVQEVEDHNPFEEYGDANDPVHETASSLCEYNKGDVEAISDADSATDQTSNLRTSGDHQPASTVISNEKDGHLTHLQEFVQASKSVPDKQYADVSFWDFAGQSIFYNTHQVFLARRTIYLLVTNIEENIDSAVTDGESVASGNYGKQVKNFVDFWINSIHFFCGEENEKGPPVILVASHADKLDAQHKNTLIASHFENVRDIFGGKVTAKHIMDDLQFAIDNTRPDENLEALKQAIVDVARVQDYWGEQQPACWISLEQELDKLRQNGVKIITVKDVEAINRTLPVPLTDAEEIKIFLCFQNNVGNFLFLSEKDLEEYVLLDPQWVVDALKCIITAEPFLKNKMKIRERWMELKKTGKLTMDIIDAVWGKPGSSFKSDQNFLLLLMQRLNLIARAKYEEPEQISDHYFVPCFITEPPIDLPEHNGPQSSSVLTLTVPSGFFPVVIFNKVIASCIKSYPISKKKERYCIYNGCAVFKEQGACVFAVFYIDNGIKVWVTSYSQGNCAKSLNTAGHSVLSFLMKSIQDNYHDERQNGVEIYASCPKLPLSSVKESFKLTSNIQEWQGMEFEELCSDHDEEPHALSKQDILRNWIPCDSTDNDPQSTGEKVTRPRNSSGPAVQQTQMAEGESSNKQTIFGKPFDYSCVLDGQNTTFEIPGSDVQVKFPNNLTKNNRIEVHGSTFRSIFHIRKRFDLPASEALASPVTEYHVTKSIIFSDYACVKMPFVGPRSELKVWKFPSDDDITNTTTRIQVPLKGRDNNEYLPDMFYEVEGSSTCLVYTRSFSCFYCTTDGRRPLKLRAFSYASHKRFRSTGSRPQHEVRIRMYIADEVMKFLDYKQRMDDIEKMQDRSQADEKVLSLLGTLTSESIIEAYVTPTEGSDNQWVHKPFPNSNEPICPKKQTIPLKDIVLQCPNCPQCHLQSDELPCCLEWYLTKIQDGTPSLSFHGHVTVDCVDNQQKRSTILFIDMRQESPVPAEETPRYYRRTGGLGHAKVSVFRRFEHAVNRRIPIHRSVVAGKESTPAGIESQEKRQNVTAGADMKTSYDCTMTQYLLSALNVHMPSVGALVSDRGHGTVFRVGSKYVMTAEHVVNDIIDPEKSGRINVDLLKEDDVYITFSASLHQRGTTDFKIKEITYQYGDLDVAILEIENWHTSSFPRELVLCKCPLSSTAKEISLIGFGHPEDKSKKTLDQKCKIKYVDDVHTAIAYLNENIPTYKDMVRQCQGNCPDILSSVDQRYNDFDNPDKLLWSCYMENGGSGSPVINHNDHRSLKVVALYTQAIPGFLQYLDPVYKLNYPCDKRFEMGPRMSSIFLDLQQRNRQLANELFPGDC